MVVQRLQHSAVSLQAPGGSPRSLQLGLQHSVDLVQVPSGIVDQRTAQYGPSRSRPNIRPTLIETPEKAQLRLDVERLKQSLHHAEQQAEGAIDLREPDSS